MANAGRMSVLRMLGKVIQSKRSLYGSKLADLHASFKAMDTDNSGTIERAELDRALDRLGLGLTQKQKLNVAEVLCCGDESGSITMANYVKIMNEAKRSYAEEMKSRRTLSALGMLRPKVRRLKAPRSPKAAEQQWDSHFAAPCSFRGSPWDEGSDIKKESLNRSVKHGTGRSNKNGKLKRKTQVSPKTRRPEWERITNRVETPLTTRPGVPVKFPGANTLRCKLSDDMRLHIQGQLYGMVQLRMPRLCWRCVRGGSGF